MIVSAKAKIKNPKQKVLKDRRYLVCVSTSTDSRTAYVYDITDQRIVYKITSSPDRTVESLFSDIYSTYKKSETRVIEPASILDVIKEVEMPSKRAKLFNTCIQLKEEMEQSQVQENVPVRESIHIRKVKELYKYIDKYKVNLNLQIVKEGVNKAVAYLFDEQNGIVKGTHKIEMDYERYRYSYSYMGKVVMIKHDLEEIFK